MIIQSRFGAAQTGLGYQFYDATGALLASRITAGITALPETGSYVATATVPSGAVGVYWNSSTSAATEDLREALGAAVVDTILLRIGTPGGDSLAQDINEVLMAVDAVSEPDNAGIAAIKAKTDNLPSDPADQSLLMTAIGAIEGLSPETIGLLDAADQILLVELHTPTESPSLVIPAPETDESLTVVYAYTENIINAKRAGLVLTFKLVTVPAKSERLLEVAAATATTDADGYAQISLQSDLRYRVTCRELGLEKIFTPTGETFDLLTLIP